MVEVADRNGTGVGWVADADQELALPPVNRRGGKAFALRRAHPGAQLEVQRQLVVGEEAGEQLHNLLGRDGTGSVGGSIHDEVARIGCRVQDGGWGSKIFGFMTV
jgi:hypothetical protein